MGRPGRLHFYIISLILLKKKDVNAAVEDVQNVYALQLIYLVVSSGVVGQFLLKELTKCSVLSLQVKHQHLQLDALLSQILFSDTRST